nr:MULTISPECIES: hypothetical protein [unclassified Arthrobacter]
MQTLKGTALRAQALEIEGSPFLADNASDIINVPSVIAEGNEEEVASIVFLLALLGDAPVSPDIGKWDLMNLDSNLVNAVGSS